MSDAVIITFIICTAVVLLGLVGSRKGSAARTAKLVKDADVLSATCSACGHKEAVAVWNGYRHCPICGAQILRG